MIRSPIRTVDTGLPKEDDLVTFLDIETSKLPFPVHQLSSDVSNLLDCARYQIQCIEEELRSDTLKNHSEILQDALDDGFFLCDLNVIQRKLQRWHVLFPRIKPFFAVKCNPNQMVASVLGQHHRHCGFDCASLSEIRLALQCTSDAPRRILYANPQRAERDLEQALELGIHTLTFDDAAELHKIHKAYQTVLCSASSRSKCPAELVLRILVPDDTSTIPLGEKFGAPLTKVECLVREAMRVELVIVGISFHCGSDNHDPKAYEQAIFLARDAMEIVNRIQGGNTCRLLDIGGGYPGLDGGRADVGRFMGRIPMEDESSSCDQEYTAAAIASVVTPLVDRLFPDDTHIISEPGRYFVQAAFALCSRIYSVRVDQKGIFHYYIPHGVQGVFKDVILCGEMFIPIPLGKCETPGSSNQLCKSIVHGPSGESYDLVCRDVLLPRLQVGDWLVFDRMGAYTLSIATRNGSQPIRYVMGAR